VLLGALAASALAQPGPGRGPGARWGSDFTPGWSMMSAQERNEHRERMCGFTNHDECRKHMDQHHEQVAEPAKARGMAMPAQPRHDACAGLKNK
jgi:hypothetical protein